MFVFPVIQCGNLSWPRVMLCRVREGKLQKRKQILVTGATSGIGLAIAETLVKADYRVFGCGRRKERLSALENQLGERFTGMVCDLREATQIEALFEQIQAACGGLDGLINNAGLGHLSPLLSGTYAHWDETLRVNVLALSYCTKLAIEQMRRKGDYGDIIHISSMAGHRVPEESGMYCASKFAVRALTESLRRELRTTGSKIRIGAVSPGFVETEFAAHYHRSESKAQETYSRYPVIQPEDIAAQVLFMLQQPPHVQIHDILVRPTEQPS